MYRLSTRVYSWPGRNKKSAPRAVRWISRLHPITLITGIETKRESYPPNRVSGQNFHRLFDHKKERAHGGFA